MPVDSCAPNSDLSSHAPDDTASGSPGNTASKLTPPLKCLRDCAVWMTAILITTVLPFAAYVGMAIGITLAWPSLIALVGMTTAVFGVLVLIFPVGLAALGISMGCTLGLVGSICWDSLSKGEQEYLTELEQEEKRLK